VISAGRERARLRDREKTRHTRKSCYLREEMDFVAAGKMFFVDGKKAEICRVCRELRSGIA
jgi:hypothetical protein